MIKGQLGPLPGADAALEDINPVMAGFFYEWSRQVRKLVAVVHQHDGAALNFVDIVDVGGQFRVGDVEAASEVAIFSKKISGFPQINDAGRIARHQFFELDGVQHLRLFGSKVRFDFWKAKEQGKEQDAEDNQGKENQDGGLRVFLPVVMEQVQWGHLDEVKCVDFHGILVIVQIV